MAVKIGILGEIRAGKDTVAEMLSVRLSGNTELFKFSDGIHEVINLTMPELYGLGKPRGALQTIGQAVREVKPDVWVDMLFNSTLFDLSESKGDNIIITDVRQPNEVSRLQDKGYTILKIVAEDGLRIERVLKSGDNFSDEMFAHETETLIHQSPYDYLINNSGTLQDLSNKLDEILITMSEEVT